MGSLWKGRGINMSMQYANPGRARRRRGGGRILFIAAILILLAGLFVQITMLARISSQNKQASALEKEIVELSASAENLQLSISQHHNLDTIAARAQQMGMEEVGAGQLRVVSVAYGNEDTSTRTVELIDGEKVLN